MTINVKATHHYLLCKFEEHDRCCQYTIVEINSWLSQLIFIYYMLSIPIFDMCLAFICFEDKLWLRLVMIGLTILVGGNVFVVNQLLTRIGSKAHQSYKFLNSLMATKKLSLRVRMKCLNLIERSSGPLIGIYCLDLFPFTNYECYVFIVNVISNFFMVMENLQ